MTKVELILEQARGLTPAERQELVAALVWEASDQSAVDQEHAVGQRGWRSWTEAVKDEDWEAFYPPELRRGADQLT